MAKDNKKVPLKNYIYLLLIIFFSIILVYYMYLWFMEYNKNQYENTNINNVMQIINYNELDAYLTENKNAVVYATITNKKEINNFEKKLEKLIETENIINQILYLDITDIENENQLYKISDTNIKVPSILVYQDGKLEDKYEISENNYNIRKIDKYLKTIGVIKND